MNWRLDFCIVERPVNILALDGLSLIYTFFGSAFALLPPTRQSDNISMTL